MHTQTVLDFKLNLEVITRNDIFQKKFSVTQQKSYAVVERPLTISPLEIAEKTSFHPWNF